ncbi:anti-sigma factor [Alteromonas aestuariivivens]|uniref:Anti-sigma factor n=1 Tax=Alteromonas aestuariivivens TaxID=1938339 RepID=A0A3D8MF17_9ALTE|nr:ChrR family anti-sigma-E factor [Alteromonas aestuariivivens]RDV29397.1 anti-sigma factor [Alteromonas aestuariivivens]
MIRCHPRLEQLVKFVEGNLSYSESILIAAHCDMCDHCRRVVDSETADQAETAFGTDVVQAGPDFDAMFARITQLPAAPAFESGEVLFKPPSKTSLELDGKSFRLPRTLQNLAGKTGNWTSLVGRLWQAPVDLGCHGVANFIYMAKGGSVPEHTHRGTEFTLVLDGKFSDGLNDYDTGDFIYLDSEHTHAPKTEFAEGCLVFSVLDQPLHFTSGLARLLNPFSHLFFR